MCGSAPSAPQLPQYPNMSPGQQQIVGQQGGVNSTYGNIVQGTGAQLGQNTNILQQLSGLFNPDGSLNQNALTSLQQSTGQSNAAAGAAGQSALGSAGSQYGPGGALAATSSAYTNALQNGAPANQSLQYQQNQSFLAMQQQAAQQGINITGTNFSNAVSNSSSGQKLISNFQQNANMQNQNYNLGYVGQLAGNMGQLGNTAAQTASTGQGLSSYSQQNPLSMISNSITQGMGALSPLLQAYGSSLSSAYQPLYQQQIGPYQQQMAQSQANYQGAMGQYNATENQLMGWGQLAGQGAGALTSAAGQAGGFGALFA